MFFITKKLVLIISTLTAIGFFIISNASANEDSNFSNDVRYNLFDTLKGDMINYYSIDTLKVYAVSFAIGGALANTSIDQSIEDKYQERIRSSKTDDFSEFAKGLGEGKILIPLSLAAAAGGYFISDATSLKDIGTWGGNTARAYLVGTPSVLLMQKLTGASRPSDTSGDSSWKPGSDNNGVSGHAFMGAVPFITLARMYEESPAKWLFYGASFLAAWSRINDSDHYFSQSALGWVMAYQSVRSVFKTDEQQQSQLSLNIYPYSNDGACVILSYSW